MLKEEVTESAIEAEGETAESAAAEQQRQRWAEEAAEFIARQVLEKGAAFRD